MAATPQRLLTVRPVAGFSFCVSAARIACRATAIISVAAVLTLSVTAIAAPQEAAIEAPQETAGAAKLATYDTSTGETFFALSLTPDVQPSGDHSVDAVIVFDTSASQTGLYRADGIEALEAMLTNLAGKTRVKLMAGDLDAVAMCDDLVAPGSAELKQGLEKLKQRSPLGSSDMNAILRSAMKCFDQDSPALRRIVYIGDGISRANILEYEEFDALIKALVRAKVSVSSYAIGPARDIHLLAAVANHTGGMVYLDATENSVSQVAGTTMANIVRTPVIWPMDSKGPKEMREAFPNIMPPLRFDRDSILIGSLSERNAMKIKIDATLAGKPIQLEWDVEPEPSSDEFGFLPPLVESARKNGGLYLATVGSAGLEEVGRVVLASAETLAEIGSRAMQAGKLADARKMAEAVLRRDPNNPQAQAILRAIEKKEGSQTDDDALIIKKPGAGER